MSDKKWVFSWSETGDEDVYFNQADDPEIAPFKQEAAGQGLPDISRIMQGVPYAGTSAVQEMEELETNMRSLIAENKYGYKLLESTLLSIGYGLNKIRRVFRKITGAEPEIYMDAQPYLDTPPSIPQYNYGWGAAKGGECDYLFIMPWVNDYCIFGQKGDVDREIVAQYPTLEAAMDALKGKVKELFHYDKTLTDELLEKDKPTRVSMESFPFGMKVAAEDDEEKGKDKNEDKDTATKRLKDEEFFETESPQHFLENNVSSDVPVVDVIGEIFNFVDSAKDNVAGYQVSIQGLKYLTKKVETVETTPQMKGVEIDKSSFEVPATFSVVLNIERESKSKKGLMVFLYSKEGELITNGTFKGQDGRIFAFSPEGLASYFGE